MKKVFINLIIVLLLNINVYADSVSKEDAEKVAKSFFGFYAPKLKASSNIATSITEKYEGEESFYVFAFENGGFVIVSADDYAKPILAYSFTNPISENPEVNTRELFERYNREISYLKQRKNTTKSNATFWDELKTGNLKGQIKSAGPLLTTTWNQSPLYNALCPSSTPTGCVATAMAQIMNYHQWPISGNGWHKYIPSDNPSYGVQYADFSSETYDWANTPTSLSSGNTQAEIDAVSTLCYHAGVSVDMNYDTDGSGSYSTDVLYALTNYFKYDHATINFTVFNPAEETSFVNTIKSEIDNSRPVYYDGSSAADGGHAWVCDGYDNTDKVHINWGWGGTYNGYFEVSSMKPDPSIDFTEFNAIITGIKPGIASQDMLWVKQHSAFLKPYRGTRYISAVNERVAWAIAADGSGNQENVKEFTRTASGGASWESGIITVSNADEFSASMITAIDEFTAWVPLFGPTGGGKIVKTTDGGKTWTQQSTAAFSAPGGFPNIIYFWDENNGFCQGDPNGGYFEIYTTANGGTTWTRVPQGNIPSDISGEYGRVGHIEIFGNNIWYGTNKGRIFKSVDKGLNWTVTQLSVDNSSFNITFKDANNGIALTTDLTANKMYKTTNGGTSWTEVVYNGSLYFNDISYVPGTNVLISTGSDYQTPAQGISYSTDDGATFVDYANFYKNYQFLALGASSSNAVWAGGFSNDLYSDGMWHLGDILVAANPKTNGNMMCCAGEDITFSDDSYGNPDTWSWDFGDGASPATAIGAGPHTVNYPTAGLKDLTMTVSKGADTHVSNLKEYITVSSTVPDDAGTITGGAVVTAKEVHTYSVTNQSLVNFNWNIPSEWIGMSNSNSLDIYFTEDLSLGTITVTPTNGCGSGTAGSLEVTVNPTALGGEVHDNDPLSIYPNPATDHIMVSGIESAKVSIYTIEGILVKQITEKHSNEPIDIRELKTGIYFIKLSIDNKTYTKVISKL